MLSLQRLSCKPMWQLGLLALLNVRIIVFSISSHGSGSSHVFNTIFHTAAALGTVSKHVHF